MVRLSSAASIIRYNVSGMDWNECPESNGIGVRNRPERVSGMPRNTQLKSKQSSFNKPAIGVNNQVEVETAKCQEITLGKQNAGMEGINGTDFSSLFAKNNKKVESYCGCFNRFITAAILPYCGPTSPSKVCSISSNSPSLLVQRPDRTCLAA